MTTVMSKNMTDIIFDLLKEQNLLYHPKILTYDIILAPKNDTILTNFTKMTHFDQIDHINDIFDQIYINKPD